MPGEAYVLGIDAGGTSTRCWAVSLDGRVLGVAKSGPGNLYAVGIDGLKKRILEVVAQACDRSWPAEALCLGAAGVGRRDEVELVHAALSQLNLAKELLIENDGIISLAAGALGEPGVAVIAGTGSIAVAMNADGQRARAGGWGYLLGDEGSGYDIAHRALIAVLRGHDGRDPATALEQVLLASLGLKNPEELVDLVYRQGIAKERMAALAPLVLSAAENDQVAADIVNYAANELAKLVVAVHERLSLPGNAPIVAAGGMFKNTLLVARFTEALQARLPAATMVRVPWEPSLGAVFLALRRAGVHIDMAQAQALAAQIDALKG